MLSSISAIKLNCGVRGAFCFIYWYDVSIFFVYLLFEYCDIVAPLQYFGVWTGMKKAVV